jgi:Tfp pilus assembly protein PilX
MKAPLNSIKLSVNNENGSVIVVALFILVMVTILGITATNTSTLELQIASNDQFIKMAFYNADSAVSGTSKLISQRSTEAGWLLQAPETMPRGSPTSPLPQQILLTIFTARLAGYDVYTSTQDLDFTPGGINARADARRVRQAHVAGGGAEFATGAEGVGPSAIAIYYDVNTGGFSNRQTTSNLTAAYRKMVGIPGGL